MFVLYNKHFVYKQGFFYLNYIAIMITSKYYKMKSTFINCISFKTVHQNNFIRINTNYNKIVNSIQGLTGHTFRTNSILALTRFGEIYYKSQSYISNLEDHRSAMSSGGHCGSVTFKISNARHIWKLEAQATMPPLALGGWFSMLPVHIQYWCLLIPDLCHAPPVLTANPMLSDELVM